MRHKRPGVSVLVAVFSLMALLLAACAPAVEPAPEQAAPPATEEPAAEEPAAEEPTTKPADEEPAEEPVPLEVTAYVVGYHWGWAVFEEDGNELDVLQVPAGTTVELLAVNDHAAEAIAQLPEPVAEAIGAIDYHERVHHAVEEGLLPDPGAEGMSLAEVLDEAHDGHNGHADASRDHGLMVAGVGARAVLEAHAREPERLVFTVDDEGTFEFRCTEDCGYGHDYQRREMLAVEA